MRRTWTRKLRLRRLLSTSGVTLSQWSGRYSALPLTNSQYRDCREDMDGQLTNPGPCFVSDNQINPGSTGGEGRIRWRTQLRDQMDDHGTGDPNIQQSSPRRQLPALTDRAPKSRHPPGLDTPPKGDDIASATGADKPAEDVPHGCSVRRLSRRFESYLSGVERRFRTGATWRPTGLNRTLAVLKGDLSLDPHRAGWRV